MRPVTRLAATLVALLATPAWAQNTTGWQTFRGAGGISAAIDPSSIATANGNRRTFRTRLGKPGDPRSVLVDMVADCGAKTIGATRGERYVNGKRIDAKEAVGAAREERPVKGDATATAMLAFVCKH